MMTFTADQIAQFKAEGIRLSHALQGATAAFAGSAGTRLEQREAIAQVRAVVDAIDAFLARDRRPATSPAWDLVGDERHPSPVA